MNKKLDYSAPILFVPRGVQTQTKPAVVKPAPTKATPSSPLAVPALRSLGEGVNAAKGGVSKSNTQKKAPTVMAPVVKKPELPKAAPAPVAKKEEVKPIETKKETPKKDEPIPTPVKKEVAPIVPPKEAPIAKALDVQQTIVPVIPENAHVSDNYREVEALRRHAQLQNEIIQCWKPPFGVPPTCACDISFSVSPTGTVHDIIIKKSSGVVMYDISARQALHAMTMPKWTYGKQLIINFKQ